MNALRVFHPLCRVPDFKKICLEDHQFPVKTFDMFVTEVQDLFKLSIKNEGKEDWQMFINACASSTGFLTCFEERLQEFQPIIIDLIRIIKDKTDVIRKNAAILLAKLANDEENKQYIRANHGFDVLMSLKGQF